MILERTPEKGIHIIVIQTLKHRAINSFCAFSTVSETLAFGVSVDLQPAAPASLSGSTKPSRTIEYTQSFLTCPYDRRAFLDRADHACRFG